MSYYPPDYYEYTSVPPPPRPHQFIVPDPSASAFSPTGDRFPVPSPVVVAASPNPSRSSSRHRGRTTTLGEQHYLAPSGGHPHRSNSERGRVMVESSGRSRSRHSRSQSGKLYYQEPKKTYYIDDHDGDSAYSGSSYGGDSRDHSRSHSRHRGSHSRASSCASNESYDSRYAVQTYHRPSRQEEELTSKLKEIQKQLEKVQVDADKKKLNDQQARQEKLRNEEIERKVQEQIKIQRQKDEDAARAQAAAIEAEKKRITEAAKKLLEEQAAAAAAKKAEEDKRQAEIQAIVDKERAKYNEAQQGKKTYTRFSKVHLCKEALEERNIPFTEELDHFLVHRFVEKIEQQHLWNRTAEIRNYYATIQARAESAPTVPGPNGGYVKYVQIEGQPYPLALPVNITRTPGGGQTQRVEPMKIKWSDIFKGT